MNIQSLGQLKKGQYISVAVELCLLQGRRHTFLAGGGDAFQRSLSGRINGMTCVFYGTGKYVNWLRSI